MKKILILLLLMGSTNVLAEWTRVDNSSDGDTTVYADFGTIKRKGHKVKMWDLYDFKTVKESEGGKRYLSSLSRNEYDCEEETSRLLDLYWYSGNMKSGEIIISLQNIKEEAESIIPGSVSKFFFNIACDKK